MALIYAWGPLSGLHVNPAVTFAFAGRGVFPQSWILPYWIAQFAGAILGALFLQRMYGHVAAGGTYPIVRPGGDWRRVMVENPLSPDPGGGLPPTPARSPRNPPKPAPPPRAA